MKKSISLVTFFLVVGLFSIKGQSDWGIKGGLNFNTNGELTEFLNETSEILKDEGSSKTGFNIGFYGKLDLGPVYLRPELVYTHTNSEYNIDGNNEDFKMSKLDLPILVGFNVIGPLDIFAGPAFQYILEDDLNGLNYSNVKNNTTLGMNIGASVKLGRFGLDARYERGLTSNEAEWTDAGNKFTLDSRPEQLIFSLSYSLKK